MRTSMECRGNTISICGADTVFTIDVRGTIKVTVSGDRRDDDDISDVIEAAMENLKIEDLEFEITGSEVEYDVG